MAKKSEIQRLRDSMSRLRDRGRMQTEMILSTGVALGGAFGYGFARGKEMVASQWWGIDTDLILGGIPLLLGMSPKGKYAEAMRHTGIAILGGWSRDLGYNQAKK